MKIFSYEVKLQLNRLENYSPPTIMKILCNIIKFIFGIVLYIIEILSYYVIANASITVDSFRLEPVTDTILRVIIISCVTILIINILVNVFLLRRKSITSLVFKNIHYYLIKV